MQLYSTTSTDLTLISYTRTLLGDSDAAPVTMFSDNEYTNAINIGYKEAWKIARRLDVGWGYKTAYATSTASQILYDLPTDIDGRIVDVAIETNGKDLSSDSDAIWTYLEPMEAAPALKGHRLQEFSYPKYVFKQDRQYGIVSPPTAGGSSAIHIQYEAELADSDLFTYVDENTAVTDEPIIPESDHDLLCYLAAITLRISKNLPTNDIRIEAARKYPMFIEQAAEPLQDLWNQMGAIGREDMSTTWFNKTGFVRRR